MTVDLLPCPFCQGNNLRISKLPLIDQSFKDFKMYDSCVQCLECGADGPKMAFVKNVTQSWNERK